MTNIFSKSRNLSSIYLAYTELCTDLTELCNHVQGKITMDFYLSHTVGGGDRKLWFKGHKGGSVQGLL